MQRSIFLVHHDRTLRAKCKDVLERAGYAVQEEAGLEDAWVQMRADSPDLLVIPWTNGDSVLETLTRLRARELDQDVRTIVVAHREDLHQAVSVLEMGADDCLAAPFTGEELLARVSASLRRPRMEGADSAVQVGPMFLDKAAHCLFVHGQPVELAPTEFRLLSFFLGNQGRVFSRGELLERAWPKNISAGQRTVDVHVRRLRQALEPHGCDEMIQTVRGFGYRFSSRVRPNALVSNRVRVVTPLSRP